MNRIKRFIKKHKYLFLFTKNAILPFQEFYYKYLISDERLLKRLYKKRLGKELNLKNPKTFNEKLQYLKLVQRDEKFSIMSDKYRVREYVKEKIGEDILVPLLWHGKNPKDIPWEKLPNKFVIKANHNSGPVIIVTDKEKIDKKWVEKELKYQLRVNYYLKNREYNYKNIPRKIIIEKLLESEDGKPIKDYRFFCFDGKPEFIAVDIDINNKENTRRNLYDLNWNLMEEEISYPKEISKSIKKPDKLDKMIEISKKLSEGLVHARIDFYVVNNKIYFSEITFYHQSGLGIIRPAEFDKYLGNLIEIGIST
jgi:hypothetical protein